MAIKFKDLMDAFEASCFGGGLCIEAIVNKETGQTYLYCDDGDGIDPLPDDIDSERDKYKWLPQKNDLDLGKRLVFDFAYKHLSSDTEYVERIFQKRGGYGRFRDLLEDRKMTQQWYDFEAVATEKALREWCIENKLEVTG